MMGPETRAVRTLRVRAGALRSELVDARQSGELCIPSRESVRAGEEVEVEVSFGPLADEVVLAGIVRPAASEPGPVLRVELSRGQAHKLEYVAAVLDGGRQAAARRHRRLPSNIPVNWRESGSLRSSRLRDISAGGAFILSREPPRVGDQIEVVLQPGRTLPRVAVASVVSWVHEKGEHPGFGVLFKPADPTVAQQLSEVVRQHEMAAALA